MIHFLLYKKISESIFNSLYKKVIHYYNQSINTKTYLFDGFAGAAPKYALNVRIIAKKAWNSRLRSTNL